MTQYPPFQAESPVQSEQPFQLEQPFELLQPAEREKDPYTEDFELILDRRQVIAGVTFLVLVLLAVFSGGSYVAGKVAPTPKIEKANVAVPEAPAIPIIEATEAPLFANPVPKVLYIQMGAVEKGIAVVFAEGLRKRGFESFVAPGPNEQIFRVLIGPFQDADAYRAAKASLNEIGINTFARRYEE
jgi:hypothetical protein